jgi:tetratricopeptide (TPR) repeat protein
MVGNEIKVEPMTVREISEAEWASIEVRQPPDWYDAAQRRDWDLNAAQQRSSHYELRCYSHLMKGNYDLALADCNKAIRLSPKSPQAYELRGKIYSAIGQANLAAADYHEAIRLKTANKVFACYKAGSATVADMYACAGVWVTPRILTLCFLEADCPVIPDTIYARSVVDVALGGP